MKVVVRRKEGKRVFVWFPLWLLINHVTLLIGYPFVRHMLKKHHNVTIRLSAMMSMLNAVIRMRLCRRSCRLVEADVKQPDSSVKVVV